MGYKLIVDFSPVHELIISLYQYINHKQHKNFFLDDKWYAAVKQKLTSHFATQLEDERFEVLHRINLLVWQYKGEQTIEAFLLWLNNQPVGEIYERLSPWVSSVPGNLGEIRDRMVHLLAEWNEQYFKHIDPNILRALEQDVEEKRKLLGILSNIDLVEEATNGLWLDEHPELETVILTPQYHCHPATVLDYYENLCTCLYPSTRAIEIVDEQNGEMHRIVAVTQALADPNRLKILRALSTQNLTFTDIHKILGLAKSTTNHHISTLRRAGLIRAHHFGKSTAQEYSLRLGELEKIGNQLTSFISSREFNLHG